MTNIIIRPADFKLDHQAIFAIRSTVFIEGQDCPYPEEFDGLDDQSEHFLAVLDDQVVGYCRLRMVEEKAKLERFAVYEAHRGQGIGEALVKFLLNTLENREVNETYLNAQIQLKGWYETLGFKARGSLFFEAGIEHIAMYYAKE